MQLLTDIQCVADILVRVRQTFHALDICTSTLCMKCLRGNLRHPVCVHYIPLCLNNEISFLLTAGTREREREEGGRTGE